MHDIIKILHVIFPILAILIKTTIWETDIFPSPSSFFVWIRDGKGQGGLESVVNVCKGPVHHKTRAAGGGCPSVED